MPSKSAYLIAGASGSHPFETPAEYVTSDGGIVLTSEYPAGYKFYVINAYNGYDIEVDATIEVTKHKFFILRTNCRLQFVRFLQVKIV